MSKEKKRIDTDLNTKYKTIPLLEDGPGEGLGGLGMLMA